MSARLFEAGFLVFCLALAAAPSAHAQSDEEIAAARARGVKYLKQQQKGDGSWNFSSHDVGITALCAIALIENAVPLSDPGVQRAYEYVKKNCAKLKNTYDLSLVIVLLSRQDRPVPHRRPRAVPLPRDRGSGDRRNRRTRSGTVPPLRLRWFRSRT